MELITTTPPTPAVEHIRNRLAHISGDAGMDLDPIAHMHLIEAYGELQEAHLGEQLWPPPDDDQSQGFSPGDLHRLATDLGALIEHAVDHHLDPLHLGLAARRIHEAADLLATQ